MWGHLTPLDDRTSQLWDVLEYENFLGMTVITRHCVATLPLAKGYLVTIREVNASYELGDVSYRIVPTNTVTHHIDFVVGA